MSSTASFLTFFLDRFRNDTANLLVDGTVAVLFLYAMINLTFIKFFYALKKVFVGLKSKFKGLNTGRSGSLEGFERLDSEQSYTGSQQCNDLEVKFSQCIHFKLVAR